MDVLAHQDQYLSDMHAPYDAFDFDAAAPNSPSAAHFPHTPSYNGSYQNSPFSDAHSDLSYDPHDLSIDISPGHFMSANANGNGGALFEGADAADVGITVEGPEGAGFDYDPRDYDGPGGGTGGGLLLFGTDFGSSLESGGNDVSVAVTPPMDQGSPHSFDHSSPASSYGEGNRSRASSVSSQGHHHQQFDSFQQSMMYDQRPSPPPNKPQSPPQLLIPEGSPNMPAGMGMPTINAPDGEGGGMGGPQLHIVPATPVSGGGVGTAVNGFQETLENLSKGAPSNSSWQSPPQDDAPDGAANLSVPFGTASSGGGAFVFPRPQPSPRTAPQTLPVNTDPQPPQSTPNTNTNSNNNISVNTNNLGASSSGSYLLPQSPSRIRSKSDTSLRPPLWSNAGMGQYSIQQQQYQQDASAVDIDIDGAGIRMADVSPQHSPEPGQASFGNILHPQHAGMQHGYSFGPPSSGGLMGAGGSAGGGFLSPDMGIGAANLRRAKSDGGSRMGHRMVRSEDYGSARRQGMGMDDMLGGGMGMRGMGMDLGGLGMGMGGGGGGMDGMGLGVFPPSSHQEFISLQQKSSQFLHPHHSRGDSLTLPSPSGGLQLPLPSIGGRGRGGGRVSGHTRRASSGSRSGRSPYPSPSASPRMGVSAMGSGYDSYDSAYEAYDDVGGGGVPNVSGLARGLGRDGMGGDEMGGLMGPGKAPANPQIPVTKQNVTTHATKDASERRRKGEANFVCPIPGCGSTFTRGFNLKGHLRSHTDDRPFQCKWPGCEKSFARQHDCKRHEALHLGVRDFKCGGCQKEFARMDALNRHLRSEGGAECQKLHQEAQEEKARMRGTPSSMFPKAEPGEWAMGGVMM